MKFFTNSPCRVLALFNNAPVAIREGSLEGSSFFNAAPALSPLDLLIFIPILAAVAMAFGAPARNTALVAALANAVLTLWLILGFRTGDTFAASRILLDSPELKFAVGLDGISLVLVILTVLVTLCAVWIKAPERVNERLYYSSSLLISAGALGAFVSTDLFFLYAFHELALVPTFLMIGLYGYGGREKRIDAAWKITLYLGFGSLVLLVGLAWLVLKGSPASGLTFDLAKLRESAPLMDAWHQEHIFLILLLGFGILISLFPFHSWAAPAYAAAPTPVAMLHAGVLKKFGLYGLLRVALPLLPAGAHAQWLQHLLLWLLLGNILIIGLVTIAQKELDLVLGNSSVMHMGYIFLGLACGNALGYNGALLLMFAHGISIALLFALANALRERTGTLELSQLGGLGKPLPFLGLAFGFATMASIGLPGFANFAAEFQVFFGAFSNTGGKLGPLQWTTILALWGVVISAVYMLRAYRAVFKGESNNRLTLSGGDLTLEQRLPMLVLLAALLVVGFFPNSLLHLAQKAIAAIAH